MIMAAGCDTGGDSRIGGTRSFPFAPVAFFAVAGVARRSILSFFFHHPGGRSGHRNWIDNILTRRLWRYLIYRLFELIITTLLKRGYTCLDEKKSYSSKLGNLKFVDINVLLRL